MSYHSNNVFKQSVSNTMDRNYKGAVNFNLIPWLVMVLSEYTGNG